MTSQVKSSCIKSSNCLNETYGNKKLSKIPQEQMEPWGHQEMFKEMVSQETGIYEEGGERKQPGAALGERCQRGLTRWTMFMFVKYVSYIPGSTLWILPLFSSLISLLVLVGHFVAFYSSCKLPSLTGTFLRTDNQTNGWFIHQVVKWVGGWINCDYFQAEKSP